MSYQEELLRERIPLLPPRRDFVSQIPRLVHVGSITSPGIPFRKFPDILAAGAQQCAAKGDVDGFRRIIGDWRALVTNSVRDGDTMIDLLVAKVTMTAPAPNFRDAANALGLDKEARYFADLYERSRLEKEARDQRRSASIAEDEISQRKSSIFGVLTGPLLARQVTSPPKLTDEDMRPARYADHALVGRVLSAAGWALLGLVLLISASVRGSPLARGLGRRMTALLRPRDWVWLMAGGVVFPVLWYLLITRLTPLASREWSVTYWAFIPACGQFGCFFLSLLILPPVIASELLAKRGAMFALEPRFPWLGWWAAVIALLGVPAFGAVPLYFQSGILVFVLVIFPAISVVAWILAGLAFGRPSHALRRAVVCRIILPARVGGILALALLIPYHYAEEQRWIQLDRLGEISTDAPALSRYEYQVTQILRAELLEMIGSSGEVH
jgi:hypothetical protein